MKPVNIIEIMRSTLFTIIFTGFILNKLLSVFNIYSQSSFSDFLLIWKEVAFIQVTFIDLYYILYYTRISCR
jgi:hypothetical protein